MQEDLLDLISKTLSLSSGSLCKLMSSKELKAAFCREATMDPSAETVCSALQLEYRQKQKVPKEDIPKF